MVQKRYIAIGLILISLILVVFAFGEVSSVVPNLTPDSYTLTCDVVLNNAPIVSPWIESVECSQKKSSLFTIWDVIDNGLYDRGYIELTAQGKSVVSSYVVEEFTGKVNILCPPLCFDSGSVEKTLILKGLEAQETRTFVNIDLYDVNGNIIDTEYIDIIIGG